MTENRDIIRVMVVDDHTIVREGMKNILSECIDIMLTDEAEAGQEALDKLKKGDIDVVLLDISMPGMDGLETLRNMRDIYPRVKVLILSVYPEEQYARRALKAGASGYLSKTTLTDDLINAIRTVYGGKKHITAHTAQQLADSIQKDPDASPHESLSNREFIIFRKIASGMTPQKIAQEMSLSVKTISTYRLRILRKLNLKSSVDIARYAMEYDLL